LEAEKRNLKMFLPWEKKGEERGGLGKTVPLFTPPGRDSQEKGKLGDPPKGRKEGRKKAEEHYVFSSPPK